MPFLKRIISLDLLRLALMCMSFSSNYGQNVVDNILANAVDEAVEGASTVFKQRTGLTGRLPPLPAGFPVPQPGPIPQSTAPPISEPISPQDKLDLFTGQTEDVDGSLLSAESAKITERALQIGQARIDAAGIAGQPGASSSAVREKINEFIKAKRTCNLPVRRPCVPNYPYRVPDGTCNNPNPNIIRGAAITAQARFLPAEYGDKDNSGSTPRIYGRNGHKLSSPRAISNTVLAIDESPRSTTFTLALVHFAQLVDHDVIFTPNIRKINETTGQLEKIRNCNQVCEIREACFPFKIPDNDNNFNDTFNNKCMHFVRSESAPGSEDCRVGPREHVNERTSFLDMSSTYGSSHVRTEVLREKKGGRLNASDGDLLPLGPGISDCLTDSQTCFNSGDDRHQEIPLLTVMHIVFLREHNRIAGELSKINPHWNDEKLYQESRKILTGIYQHIVFNEFIPLVIGYGTAVRYGLISNRLGHANTYVPWIDPSTRNEFGAAAYRFGHSLVGRTVSSMNSNFQIIASHFMKFDFFNNTVTRNTDGLFGPNNIGRWMANTFMRERDRFISDQVRNHLMESNTTFDKPSDGFDLASFNIQRGRDHGIPGYNKYRAFCGLPVATMFFAGPMGLRDHDYNTVLQLQKVYKHPDDIDLFVGGISERPSVNGEILGPTFKCLVALQFQKYKYGDRFFYETPEPLIGFNLNQLNNIKRQTFAGLYCRSLQLSSIQRKAFVSPGRQFPPFRVPCKSLPEPNLLLWKE